MRLGGESSCLKQNGKNRQDRYCRKIQLLESKINSNDARIGEPALQPAETYIATDARRLETVNVLLFEILITRAII